MSETGLLLILCGPSGVGKTTLAHHLLERHPELVFSISYTTRPRRDGEVDGEDYSFVSKREFEAMRDGGGFAEWAQVHGNLYGTANETIRGAWESGRNVIFDIDYQGAQQLLEKYSEETIAVLIVPPSMAELEERLRGRDTDSDEVIDRRLKAAQHELRQWRLYDYVVENADLERAKSDLNDVYRVAKMQTRFSGEHLQELIGQ